jgi:hypothetical protein
MSARLSRARWPLANTQMPLSQTGRLGMAGNADVVA